MNVDQQQQQKQQQQYPPSPAVLLAPSNYHHYNATTTASTATTTLLAAPTAMPQPPTTATYVTIGLMPQPGYNLNAAAAAAATTATTSVTTTTMMMPASASATTPTSSFKTTPLLPMPTLEDIECGAGGSIMIVSGAPDGNMLPPGILKYSSMPPTPAFTTTTTPMPMMAMPTTQLRSSSSPPAQYLAPSGAQTTIAAAAADACSTLKSNNKLAGALSGTTQQQRKAQAPLPPPPPGLLSTSSTIASNIAIGSSNNCSSSTSAINNAGGAGSNNNKLNTNSNSNSNNNSNSNLNGKRHKARRKCCSCFSGDGGGGVGHDVGVGSDASSKYTTTKKTKKTQTLWAGLLTNLGICALLLAYTLLGSFIFLTIENEDSSLLHQQRTLASTKRVAGVGVSSETGRGSGSESRNIYHTQPHHLDNGTVAAVSYSSSSSAASSSSSAGTSAMNGNHEFGITDSQLALSAETYDVRQRTIENIWDITVSLNILYKENWTKLAALEIAKFQDQLVKRLNEDALLQLTHDLDVNGNGNSPATEAVLLLSHQHGIHGQPQQHEWNFAKAFLYSLTVLTTIGYGNIAPKTTLGRLVTLAYAILGIPLTLVYLSSTGGILAKVAREVFSKALCCCMCSNCGYCCYDEKRMAEKERRMKRKRQQEELRKQHAAMQEPYYVRSGSMHSSFQSPEKHVPGSNTPMMSGSGGGGGNVPDIDSLSASESRGSMHGLSILAPILLCLSMMIIYILFGAVVLYRLENWPLLDGVYFCFMSLSTIGFGDLIPGLRKESTTTTWFCSIYIMSGMALTAMCFNVIHEEIVHRIKIVVEFKKAATLDTINDEQGYYMTAPPP